MALTIDDTSNPIIVTGTTDTATAVTTRFIKITAIYWLQPTTGGHKLAIQHRASGADVIEFYCVNNNEPSFVDFSCPVMAPTGLSIDDMDSGVLYVYVK